MERVNWMAAYALGAAFSRVDQKVVVETLVGCGLDLTVLPAARAAVSAVTTVDETTRETADALMLLAATRIHEDRPLRRCRPVPRHESDGRATG